MMPLSWKSQTLLLRNIKKDGPKNLSRLFPDCLNILEHEVAIVESDLGRIR